MLLILFPSPNLLNHLLHFTSCLCVSISKWGRLHSLVNFFFVANALPAEMGHFLVDVNS